MKEWLRLRFIEWLGGYPNAEEAIEAVESLEEKHRLLTLAVKRHFNTIGPEEILRVHPDGHWLFMGKSLSEAEKGILIAQATQLRESKLWAILRADVNWQANRKALLKAVTDLDIIAWKLWYHILYCVDTRLKSMEKGRGMVNDK